jgi:hypothetical protein
MPRVHETRGFKIYIYLPPTEHGPPHVHVLKAGGEVLIEIGTGAPLEPYRVFGSISDKDVARAVRIVQEIEQHLIVAWRIHHGN